jgi:hypothetical protein
MRVHTATQKADAYIQGYDAGSFMGGKYLNAYNPYTTFFPGCYLNAMWRDGFVVGATQKRKDTDDTV